jgi:hypothetical protein
VPVTGRSDVVVVVALLALGVSLLVQQVVRRQEH